MAQLNNRLFCALAVVVGPAAGEDANKQAPPARVINITSDSTPGWLPSIEQSMSAENVAIAYLADEDAGRAEDAYGHFAELNKLNVGFDDYKASVEKFNAQAGPVIERRIVKITWTKDSPNAPIRGVYAAIDLASRFANIDRHCGFLILYQASEGGDFQVMREEANFIDNASAAAMEKLHGRANVDQMWAQLSSNCPNYPDPATKP